MYGRKIAVFMLAGVLTAAPALSGCTSRTAALMEEYKTEGIALLEEGDYEGAAETFQTALDQSFGNIGVEEMDISYYKALALYLSGDMDGAFEVYTALIDYDEKNWESYYMRGNIYLEEGKDGAALEDYAAAAARNEGDAELCLHICANLVDAGLQDEAQDYLDEALTIQPSSGEEYYDLGRIYAQTGDAAMAETYFKQAQELGMDEAILRLAELYTDRGDSESAASCWSEYLQLYPDDPQALARLGEAALAAGEYETAVSYLRTARESAEGDDLTAIVTDLVAAYEYAGDFESAWEVAAAYLADHSDEALEREYTFLSTRVGAISVTDDVSDAAENNTADNNTEENTSSEGDNAGGEGDYTTGEGEEYYEEYYTEDYGDGSYDEGY